MTHAIAVVPWPHYSDSGRDIMWEVRVESDKFRGTLQWSTKLGRFRKANHAFRLRRGSPQIYRAAVDFMRDFCSPRCDTKSKLCDTKSAQRDSYKRDASCARGAYGCCHDVTRDVTERDCDKYRDSSGVTLSQTGSLRDPSGEVESKGTEALQRCTASGTCGGAA